MTDHVVPPEGPGFGLGGVHHLALVCRDMAATVAFYRDLLGLPLVRRLALPDGSQHFFFDIGNGDTLAFFWFTRAPEPMPGVSSPKHLVLEGNWLTAPGSMNHVAFTVRAEDIEAHRDRLRSLGVACTDILDHDDSETQVAPAFHEGVWLRSIYFFDPDGHMLEFAAWTGPPAGDQDAIDPVDATGRPVAMG
jgi:catechol 2,3-dioxygenase-like lactoylglutathione lyase family enzyme